MHVPPFILAIKTPTHVLVNADIRTYSIYAVCTVYTCVIQNGKLYVHVPRDLALWVSLSVWLSTDLAVGEVLCCGTSQIPGPLWPLSELKCHARSARDRECCSRRSYTHVASCTRVSCVQHVCTTMNVRTLHSTYVCIANVHTVHMYV